MHGNQVEDEQSFPIDKIKSASRTLYACKSLPLPADLYLSSGINQLLGVTMTQRDFGNTIL